MKALANSHAGDWNSDNPYKVCCAGLTTPSRVSGEPVIWLEDSTKDNSHAWSTEYLGLSPVYLNSKNPIECVVSKDTCPSTRFTTLASMIDPDNSHVGDSTAYDYKVCCKIACVNEKESCAYDPCCEGFYCSNVTPEGPTAPHCCSPGTYWDEGQNKCLETERCYNPALPEDFCAYLPPNNPAPFGIPQQEWWSTSLCLSAPSEACCYVQKYGTNPFYDTTDETGKKFVRVYARNNTLI